MDSKAFIKIESIIFRRDQIRSMRGLHKSVKSKDGSTKTHILVLENGCFGSGPLIKSEVWLTEDQAVAMEKILLEND